jgi:hypothetical protein
VASGRPGTAFVDDQRQDASADVSIYIQVTHKQELKMAIALTGIVSDLGSLIPSSGDIMQQVIIGAGAGVLLAGLKSNAGLDAIDPLHLIPRPAVPATATSPAVPASVSTVVGKTVTGSVFASLTPAIQDRMMSQGYTVV